jgi:predicted small secreted protein
MKAILLISCLVALSLSQFDFFDIGKIGEDIKNTVVAVEQKV